MSGAELGSTGWRFWIDRGGTFTDLVARGPGGRWVVRKVLSDQPERLGDPAVRALREVAGLSEGEPVPDGLIREVRLGTTVATNALLQGRGEPVLLVVNRGFADLLTIGDQHRPDIFALEILRPEPLPVFVVEVDGRLGADGREVRALRLDAPLEDRLRQAMAAGCRAAAVALLHSVRNPDHERRLGAWLAALGFTPVVESHRVTARVRLVPRAQTAVVEASVAPILEAYLQQVRAALGAGPRLRVMTSSGALTAPTLLQAKDTILSGPAGGMVGGVAAARAAGFGDGAIVGFDMGGTSTDVFHFDGSRGDQGWERQSETEVRGLRLQAPRLPIHTVAAGGGSVLRFDGLRLQVGPQSAGADPGPACYRRGGPLTITDANLLLGRLPADALPQVFGPGGDQGADAAVVRRRFTELADLIAAAGLEQGAAASPEQIADGALSIAIERMAEAIRTISIQRGHDIRTAVLVCYGGAGGQHACRLAETLGIERILLHPLAGVLSAYGIGLARQRLLLERSLRHPLSAALLGELELCLDDLTAEGVQILRSEGDLGAGVEPGRQVRIELRYPDSEQGLEVDWPLEDPSAAFAALHRQRFGYVVEDQPLVVERVLVELVAPAPDGDTGQPWQARDQLAGTTAEAPPLVPLCLPVAGTKRGRDALEMQWQPVPLWQRSRLRRGQELAGPAVIQEATGTIVLEPGWRARVLEAGELLLERCSPSEGEVPPSEAQPARDAPVDPVRLELYNHRFSAIAEQMGVRLQQSSRSVNIRERLDFSCALFDGAGRLVANAPHIPVHLGSMGESVTALLEAVATGTSPPLRLGDAIAANDPFHGGTHLPDITVITPVFAQDQPHLAPLAFVACRGHHADVGGITPGSMPPFSRRIEEEGLLLDNVFLLRQGRFAPEEWNRRLAAGPHPVRNPDQLLADLRAQVAANLLGVEELLRLMRHEGTAEVLAFMAHVRSNAAEAVRRVIDRLDGGSHLLELDDGSRIAVAVRIDRQRRRATVDFSGTSPQQAGNSNAPLAITKAVVLYVFRVLVGEPIPLNAGCFEPIDLVVPPGSLLNPRPPAAVVAGNVETSQAVANALFAALGVMAAAQGTMNNLSFGTDRLQYYETICGGTGAGVDATGRGFSGAAAVQSHMTNSRLTDPEILEDRFPVRVERFEIRRGSGGPGCWPGGDGVVRQLRFLQPMTASLLSGSRRVAPPGLAGGGDGATGRNVVERADGHCEELAGRAQLAMAAGDAMRIETPGGGGYGPPP